MESLTGNTVIGPPFLPADGPRFCKQFIIKNPHDVTYATAVLNLELVAASRVARIFGHTPPNNEPLVSIIHFLAIVCLESIVRFKVTSTTALFFQDTFSIQSIHLVYTSSRWKRAKGSNNNKKEFLKFSNYLPTTLRRQLTPTTTFVIQLNTCSYGQRFKDKKVR